MTPKYLGAVLAYSYFLCTTLRAQVHPAKNWLFPSRLGEIFCQQPAKPGSFI